MLSRTLRSAMVTLSLMAMVLLMPAGVLSGINAGSDRESQYTCCATANVAEGVAVRGVVAVAGGVAPGVVGVGNGVLDGVAEGSTVAVRDGVTVGLAVAAPSAVAVGVAVGMHCDWHVTNFPSRHDGNVSSLTPSRFV